jgi:hypothetical protein
VAAQLRDFFWSDPLLAVAIAAAIVAFATTPLAFAVLGRIDWFKARRGRVLQRPEFFSVVCAMVLVMAVPAIFTLFALKSRYFDKNRYEFDPNRTLSVLDQGRQYETPHLAESLAKANDAALSEQKRLAEERRKLVDGVKKLDEAMIALRAAARQAPAAAQALPGVLERLATVRKAIGLDAPQQLLDETAPPIPLAGTPTAIGGTQPMPAAVAAAPAAAVPAPVSGLSADAAAAELASVPEPQRALATMLPLTELPAGWVVAKSGERHLETFNADNLFEKIDGRAESFLQYGVKGMAYTYYHPAGDDSSEAQLYIFEMGDALRALGKYGSEKPDGVGTIALGTEGYVSAGSTLFYAGKYYTQVVTTKDDPKVGAFAMEIARRVAAKQAPEGSAAQGAGGSRPAGPEAVFGLLPATPQRSGAKFVAEDAFGYSFLSSVFMADYKDGEVTWQGFLRPYATPEAARTAFAKYLETAKQDGAQVKDVPDSGAERMVTSANIGLTDAIFLKGNALGGANGATDAAKAEAFARAFVRSLPGSVPVVEEPKNAATESSDADKEVK